MVILTDVLIIIFFSCWFILTFINQFRFSFTKKLKSTDIFHLLPVWTFFAPNPGTSDYHFVYRVMNENNRVSEFIEIPLHENRNLISAFWNAQKRVKKALADLVMSLKQICETKAADDDNIKLSFSYIALLNFLSNIPKPPDTKFIQFAILESGGFIDSENPRLIMCSEFHHV